jgi:hypothetical protein
MCKGHAGYPAKCKLCGAITYLFFPAKMLTQEQQAKHNHWIEHDFICGQCLGKEFK